ncbi:MAG: hypothetical protein JWO83_3189 [Caulobacteraceae bacterium]|jgi:hypothetical protein|nr:hypothetical protein [Caulobacteraceae bacterium]
MQDLNWAGGGQTAVEGFTAMDWAQLRDAYRSAAGRRRWGHVEAASNDFSHYLAIWHEPPAGREPPNLAVVRFDQTGTYALLAGEAFVATGASLQEILPALSASPAAPDDDWADDD